MDAISTADPILLSVLAFVAEYGPAWRRVCRRWLRVGAALTAPPLRLSALAGRGHLDLLVANRPYMIETADKCIIVAARGGPIEIVDGTIYDVGDIVNGTIYDVAMASAARHGHAAVVQLCKEWGATNFNGAMRNAACNGHLGIVAQCREWGAIDFSSAIISLSTLLDRAKSEWGATAYASAYSAASRYRREKVMALFRAWQAEAEASLCRVWQAEAEAEAKAEVDAEAHAAP